jgi:hypothetical protein
MKMNQAIRIVANAVASMNKCEAEVLHEHLEFVFEDTGVALNQSTTQFLFEAILDFYQNMTCWFSPGLALEAAFIRCARATDSLTQLAEQHKIPHTMPV